MVSKNKEGYSDPTAGAAIREADRQPERVTKVVNLMKYIAEWNGFEVTNRIWLKDKETGREHR